MYLPTFLLGGSRERKIRRNTEEDQRGLRKIFHLPKILMTILTFKIRLSNSQNSILFWRSIFLNSFLDHPSPRGGGAILCIRIVEKMEIRVGIARKQLGLSWIMGSVATGRVQDNRKWEVAHLGDRSESLYIVKWEVVQDCSVVDHHSLSLR